jgi:hypothetical protein
VGTKKKAPYSVTSAGYLDQLSDYKGSVSWNRDDGGGNGDNRSNNSYYLFAGVRIFTVGHVP